MLKPYNVTYKFYYDGELYRESCHTALLNEPREEEISGNDFNSLWDFTYQWATMTPFNMWEFKKGEKFLQHYDWLFKKITPKNCKSWKFTITSAETTISMERLMEFKTDDVIQYLKERGITTCPMNF